MQVSSEEAALEVEELRRVREALQARIAAIDRCAKREHLKRTYT